MEQHPFEETSEGRGRSLSRRELLAATGGVVLAGSLAGNAASALAASAAAKPKRGGTFRLGVTGGGAKDFIDGQSITTKPDQARLTSGWETLLTYDRNYKLGTDGLAEEATQDNARQWTIRLKDGIEFNNGKTLERRRRDLLAAAHREPEEQALRQRGPGQRRPRAASRRWTSSRCA